MRNGRTAKRSGVILSEAKNLCRAEVTLGTNVILSDAKNLSAPK